jgi:hypothetical protein
MRLVFLAALLFSFVPVNAAPVVIDFESDITYFDSGGVSTKGFDFAGNVYYTSIYTEDDGNTAIITDGTCCAYWDIGWYISSIDGNFNLKSLDIAFDSLSATEVLISGYAYDYSSSARYTAATRTVTDTNWHTETFGAEWSNLVQIDIYIVGGQQGSVSIDNFSAAVVPVPAAVWLFGSGLGLLGWFRRRQTA